MPNTRLKRYDLDLCGNPKHNDRELELMSRALGPYESKLGELLRGESISLLFSRGPIFLYLEDEQPAGLISASLQSPQRALLSLYGNTPSEPIEAVSTALLTGGCVKVSMHLFVPRGQTVEPPAGFTPAGRLACETLLDGQWLDMVILERLNPQLVAIAPQPQEQPAPPPVQPAEEPQEELELDEDVHVKDSFSFERSED